MQVIGSHFTVYRTAGVWRKLRGQYSAALNGKPPWLTLGVVLTVRDIEHHDVVGSALFAVEYPDKHPCEWMKQALIIFEEATDVHMVEVIAEPHC